MEDSSGLNKPRTEYLHGSDYGCDTSHGLQSDGHRSLLSDPRCRKSYDPNAPLGCLAGGGHRLSGGDSNRSCIEVKQERVAVTACAER